MTDSINTILEDMELYAPDRSIMPLETEDLEQGVYIQLAAVYRRKAHMSYTRDGIEFSPAKNDLQWSVDRFRSDAEYAQTGVAKMLVARENVLGKNAGVNTEIAMLHLDTMEEWELRARQYGRQSHHCFQIAKSTYSDITGEDWRRPTKNAAQGRQFKTEELDTPETIEDRKLMAEYGLK
jgi:hypothetical protein